MGIDRLVAFLTCLPVCCLLLKTLTLNNECPCVFSLYQKPSQSCQTLSRRVFRAAVPGWAVCSVEAKSVSGLALALGRDIATWENIEVSTVAQASLAENEGVSF
jgi:hypothetical protein